MSNTCWWWFLLIINVYAHWHTAMSMKNLTGMWNETGNGKGVVKVKEVQWSNILFQSVIHCQYSTMSLVMVVMEIRERQSWQWKGTQKGWNNKYERTFLLTWGGNKLMNTKVKTIKGQVLLVVVMNDWYTFWQVLPFHFPFSGF